MAPCPKSRGSRERSQNDGDLMKTYKIRIGRSKGYYEVGRFHKWLVERRSPAMLILGIGLFGFLLGVLI